MGGASPPGMAPIVLLHCSIVTFPALLPGRSVDSP